jgi:alpha-beta hydrolase superfamily lysophospholipase
MQHQELSLLTGDGIHLYGQEWRCSSPTKGVVTLVHGIGEHTGRYHHVGSAFADAGYCLVGFDLRGHGKSSGKRGVGSFDIYNQDIDEILKSVSQRFPGLPNFLYGHSLGASLVIYYLLRKHPKITGAIASAPAFAPSFPIPQGKILAGRILVKVAPNVIFHNGLPQSGLSHDEQVAPAYVHDPLVHDLVSARLGTDILDIGPWSIAHAKELDTPLFIIYGKDDPIISTEKIKEFCALTGNYCTSRRWDGMYHEVHNEIGKEIVIDSMITWCNQHVVKTALS